MTEPKGELMHGEPGWHVRKEVASLEYAFNAGDVLGVPAQCLIGTEIDYSIHMDGPTAEQEAALEATRAETFAQLSTLVPKDEAQAECKADWLAQIPDLTPYELINYQIYKRLSTPTLDAPTPDIYFGADTSSETTLEFVFGNGLYQTGYYDVPGAFEMRTQAARPTIALERIHRALAVAEEVAQAYGARFVRIHNQTNFSVWVPTETGLEPLHALTNPEGQEIARKATAGILRALSDSTPALCPPGVSALPQPTTYSTDPERGGTVRVLPDRFELRSDTDISSLELGALVLMS